MRLQLRNLQFLSAYLHPHATHMGVVLRLRRSTNGDLSIPMLVQDILASGDVERLLFVSFNQFP